MADKTYTDEETRDYYAKLAGAIIKGDAKRKKELDVCATKMLTVMRTAFPTLPDKVLCAFSASIGYLFAQALSVTARDISEFLTHCFDEYMIVAAVLAGGYDVNSTEVPKAPEPEVAKPSEEDYVPGTYL